MFYHGFTYLFGFDIGSDEFLGKLVMTSLGSVRDAMKSSDRSLKNSMNDHTIP